MPNSELFVIVLFDTRAAQATAFDATSTTHDVMVGKRMLDRQRRAERLRTPAPACREAAEVARRDAVLHCDQCASHRGQARVVHGAVGSAVSLHARTDDRDTNHVPGIGAA